MDAIVAALAAEQEEFAALLAGLGANDWDLASRCPGWTVSDVVLHLAQTDELAAGSVRGRFPDVAGRLAAGAEVADTVDDWADVVVAKERGAPGPEVRDRYLRAAADVRAALATCDPHARVTWVAGELSVGTLATTRVAETWIHTGDVAAALGIAVPPTDRLWHVCRLAWRTLPYAFTRSGRELSGPVAFELVGPQGDDWVFAPESGARTLVPGAARERCLVAARRAGAGDTGLAAEGPDAAAVVELVRTFA